MSSIQTDYLRNLVLKLSRGRSVQDIINEIRQAARKLTSADGATFILKDRDLCYYVDEDAISPLWKGNKFPMEACISGWTMINKKEAVIKDIYKDSRIPIAAYQPTFVKSLVMVPINIDNPFGAIGNYWAHEHEASEEEIRILTFLAKITSIALQNVEILDQLENSLSFSNQSQKIPDEFMSILSHELHTSKSPGFAISNEIEKFSSLIQEVNIHRNNVSKLKKVIYEISLRQLHEMDDSLRDYLQVRAL